MHECVREVLQQPGLATSSTPACHGSGAHSCGLLSMAGAVSGFLASSEHGASETKPFRRGRTRGVEFAAALAGRDSAYGESSL
jgi:hypothetical protein